LGQDGVTKGEGRCCSNVNGLFATARHVKTDSPLTLCTLKNTVHFTKSNDLTVGTKKRILRREIGIVIVCRLKEWVSGEFAAKEGMVLHYVST
jgi:hypothetical protein